MRGLAFRAAPHPAGRLDPGRRAALRAEAVPRMPIDQRARLRQDCGLAAGEQRRQGTRIDRARLARGRGFGRPAIDGEIRTRLIEPEKHQGRAAGDPLAPWLDRLPVELGDRLAADQRPQLA